ncbi:hypothetical protein LCGC14_0867770 [marine sediment metagenome]|uniref:Uncharacterized protein n=1 Tax=marine sediment metagenome TaxID=412755 RepID=A0A0F9PR80_9ZZZZ
MKKIIVIIIITILISIGVIAVSLSNTEQKIEEDVQKFYPDLDLQMIEQSKEYPKSELIKVAVFEDSKTGKEKRIYVVG